MSSQKKNCKRSCKKRNKNKKCILFEERNDWRITEIKKETFILKYINSKYEYPIPKLAGKHQIENAATAISVVKSIKKIVVEDKFIKWE